MAGDGERARSSDAARSAGLKYVNDRQPGIARRRTKEGFRYIDARGRRVTDKSVLRRIDALAVPPAYENVWICPDPNGHLQATGRDARGRKQYRYHERWIAMRGEDKYHQLHGFGRALPRIRRRVEADMAIPALCARKVVATLVRLLDMTLMRVGSKSYARENKSYGLTTLKRRHADVTADRIRLRFTGKSGVPHDMTVRDARVARIIRRCKEISGQFLFHYRDDDGSLHGVDSSMVNDYLKDAAGADFTAKDYRVWAGSVAALALLQRRAEAGTPPNAHDAAEVVKEVARLLGNTPAVCRTSYIHPAILRAYEDASLPARRPAKGPRNLNADERRLLAFLEGCPSN